jgi:hypothetical protein
MQLRKLKNAYVPFLSVNGQIRLNCFEWHIKVKEEKINHINEGKLKQWHKHVYYFGRCNKQNAWQRTFDSAKNTPMQVLALPSSQWQAEAGGKVAADLDSRGGGGEAGDVSAVRCTLPAAGDLDSGGGGGEARDVSTVRCQLPPLGGQNEQA